MSRQPKQVHIWLYRRAGDAYEYAVFRRADMPECRQGVCGGGEASESLEQAARRELSEEAGITDASLPLYRLDSISYLPDGIFSAKSRAVWGPDTVVVPMYFFAMPFDGEIILSDEHSEVQWLAYEKAYALTLFTDQKTALYELNERLRRGNLGRLLPPESAVRVSMRDENGLGASYAIVRKAGAAVLILLRERECAVFDYDALPGENFAFRYLLCKHYPSPETAYTDFLKLIGKMCKKSPDSKYFGTREEEDNRMVVTASGEEHMMRAEDIAAYVERFAEFRDFVMANRMKFR